MLIMRKRPIYRYLGVKKPNWRIQFFLMFMPYEYSELLTTFRLFRLSTAFYFDVFPRRFDHFPLVGLSTAFQFDGFPSFNHFPLVQSFSTCYNWSSTKSKQLSKI
jgi:hypothetical protein